jgi:pimeloyl-ACP methyl ester carboxylesterase
VLARYFAIFNNFWVLPAAIDLSGHRADATPPGVVTRNDDARSITGAQTEPTLLAGPSAGGFAIAAAAERDPSLVARLIYVAACILAPGLSLAGLRRPGPRQPLRGALRLSDDRLTSKVDPTAARRLLFQDCPDHTAAWAVSKRGPEPVWPQSVPLCLGRNLRICRATPS